MNRLAASNCPPPGGHGGLPIAPHRGATGGQTLPIMNDQVIIYNENIEALEQELGRRIVHMIYRKKDGSLRDAYGTRCHALIPPEYHPKGTKKLPDFLLPYWDTQRGGWRCLIRNRLIGFEEVATWENIDNIFQS